MSQESAEFDAQLRRERREFDDVKCYKCGGLTFDEYDDYSTIRQCRGCRELVYVGDKV